MATEFKPNVLPDVADHPGGFLRDDLAALAMTPAELARRIGQTEAAINDILEGRAMISEQIAQDLERVLGTPAQSWLNLCTIYRLVLENGGTPASELAADLPAEQAAQ